MRRGFIPGAISTFFMFLFCFLLARPLTPAGATAFEQELDQATRSWMQTVLDNWEMACRRDLHIRVEPLPWIIFYDESQAWHLKPEEGLIPSLEVSRHSLRFAGPAYPLMRVAHQSGKLWVPDRDPIPVDPAKPQAVAMPYDRDRKSFFIVPLPALFHRLAGPDQARDLDELFLGLAAHELTHTRHFVYAMSQIKRLRARYKLPESLDDNLIQQEFGPNEVYKRLYEEERKLLSGALLASHLDDCRRKVGQLLSSSQKRKERFFVGSKAGYSDLEDIFLAMEGLAMWVQYRTARHRAPAGEDWLKTLIKLSERTDAWSQEEGLGLFLLIDRLVPGWQRCFLARNFPSPFAVLGEAVRRRPALNSAAERRRR